LKKPLGEILQFAQKASQKVETFKDFQGGDLDAQWCTLGGLYLQYLYEYNEADGMIQLENFSRFFSYGISLKVADLGCIRLYSIGQLGHG
jgi:hypothetical protein